MTLVSVVGVFLLAGILFPVVLVPAAVVVDGVILSALAVRWSWVHMHHGRSREGAA